MILSLDHCRLAMPIVIRPALASLLVGLLATGSVDLASAADKTAPARAPADRLLTPAQARDCMAWGDKLQAQKADALKAKGEADAIRKHVEESGAELKEQVATLDRTSAEAVAAYNAKVDARDKEIEGLETKAAAYNTQVTDLQTAQEAKDKSCAQRRYDERTLPTAPAKK